MNVKISVKKLFNMEQLMISLKEGNRRYSENNFELKEALKEAEASLQRLHERCEVYRKELNDERIHSQDNATYLHNYCTDYVEEIHALKAEINKLKEGVKDDRQREE